MEKLKLVLLGSSNVQKTTIITNFIENAFPSEIIQTTSCEKSIKKIELINQKKILLEIWELLVLKYICQSIKYMLEKLKSYY